MTNNHSPLTWGIWITMLSILLIIIIGSIIVSIFYYRKTNRKFLTVKKVVIFSTFLSFFLIQAFIFAPMLKLPIPFSFDSITTIVIGFIYGPLEGILFGWVADSLRTLINGWSYSILPSLMYPMIGLISSLFGILYFKKQEIKKITSIIIFQSLIFLIILMMVGLSIGMQYVMPYDGYNNHHYGSGINLKQTTILTSIFGAILLLIIESIFIYSVVTNNTKELFLFLIMLIVASVDRGMELIIRPFTQFFSGMELNYSVSLYTRMLSTTYLVPVVAATSFSLLKVTLYVIELSSRSKN